MAPKIDLVNVKVSVNGKEQTIKMERGTSFENKGGIFTAGENNGVLKMTNYQLQAFKAMANNYTEEGEDGIVLSKKDIEEAQNKYRNGGYVDDMSEFLPEGYKIEKKNCALYSKENKVQAYVTNGNESQSATLKFSFTNNLVPNRDNNTIKIGNYNVNDIKFVMKSSGEEPYYIAVDKKGNELKDLKVDVTLSDFGVLDIPKETGFNVYSTDSNSRFCFNAKGDLVGYTTIDNSDSGEIFWDSDGKYLYKRSYDDKTTIYEKEDGSYYTIRKRYSEEVVTYVADVHYYDSQGNFLRDDTFFHRAGSTPSDQGEFRNIDSLIYSWFYK